MKQTKNLRAKLLGTSALAVLGSVWIGAGAAQAVPGGSCVTVAGATTAITCDGYNYEQILAGDDTTITLNADAVVTDDHSPVVGIDGDNSSLVLEENSSIYGDNNNYTVKIDGIDNSVTLNDGASIGSEVDPSVSGTYSALSFYGAAGTTEGSITLNGGSSVDIVGNTYDDKYSRFYGIDAAGVGVAITLNGGSSVNVTGEGEGGGHKYVGVGLDSYASTESERPSITLNSGSSINVTGSFDTDGGSLIGIYATNNLDDDNFAADIVLNGGSSINVFSYADADATGIKTFGVAPSVTLNGSSTINVTGSGVTSDGKYIGISATNTGSTADQIGAITLNDNSAITVTGDNGQYAIGIDLVDGYNTATLNGSSQVHVNAYEMNTVSGIETSGGSSSVTLNGESAVLIEVSYADEAFGIATQDGRNTIALNGDAGVSISGYYVDIVNGLWAQGGDNTVVLNGNAFVDLYVGYVEDAIGIQLNGDGNSVVMNGDAQINIETFDETLNGTGIATRGDYGSVTMNGNSSIVVGYGEDGPDKARGIRVSGYGSTLTMNDDSSISVVGVTSGNRQGGIVINDNSNMTVTLNDNASVQAAGNSSVAGIYARDVDNSFVTLNGHSSVSSANGAGIYLRNSDNNTIIIGSDASLTGVTGIFTNSSRFNEITVAGSVISTGTYAINLNGGNNTLTLNSATIDGRIRGSGLDHLVFQGEGILNDAVRGFGTLDVDASGIWDIAKYGSFDTVTINSGTLAVNGVLYADSGLTVADGGTLKGAGNIYGEISVLEGGTLAPGNSPGTLNVVGPVNFAAGSIFEVEVEGTAADLLNATGNVTIAPGAIINPVFLGGVDGYVGDIITSGGAITGTFSVGSGGAVVYSGGTVSLTATSPSSMNASVGGSAAAGFSFLDTVMGQAAAGAGTGENLWSSAIFDQSDRTSNGTGKGYHQKNRGGAFGGTLMQTDATTVGLAGGYIDTDVDTVSGGSETSMSGFNLAAYGTYRFGGTVLTAAITGAYQDQDISRNVLVGGAIGKANGSPKAWLGGVGVGIAHPIPLEKGFTLTPKANIGWLHTTRDGYTETGGGAAAMSVDEISTETIRGQVGAELSVMIKDPNAQWSVRPNIHAGLAQEWRNGDANATGTFTATGAAFTAQLDNRDQTYLAIGAGVDVVVGPDLTAFASYDGGVSGDTERSGGFRLGARWNW